MLFERFSGEEIQYRVSLDMLSGENLRRYSAETLYRREPLSLVFCIMLQHYLEFKGFLAILQKSLKFQRTPCICFKFKRCKAFSKPSLTLTMPNCQFLYCRRAHLLQREVSPEGLFRDALREILWTRDSIHNLS